MGEGFASQPCRLSYAELARGQTPYNRPIKTTKRA